MLFLNQKRQRMSRTSKIVYFIISIIFFTCFDLVLSDFVVKNIEKFPQNSVLDLISVQNTGAAFSIFLERLITSILMQDARVFLICFSVAAILWIVFYTIKSIEKSSTLTLFWVSMLVSGIFCNLYERIALGYVRDFFKLNFVNFPVFNISDIFINVSVFAIVVIIIKHNFSKNNETDN